MALVEQQIWVSDLRESFKILREESCNGYPIYSSAMFCPVCRKVWAELFMTNQTKPVSFVPHMVGCSTCRWTSRNSDIPATILFNGLIFPEATDWPLLYALPFELLEREFNLHLEAMK
jgi:hypothetical protein